MNVADVVANILKAEGVELLPAYPNSEVIEGCSKVGIRPIIVRQERQAVHIADGYARVTGGLKLAATAVQEGPGSENAYGAVAQSYGDHTPLLHIPAGYSRARQGIHPFFSASHTMKDVSKCCEFVTHAERVPLAFQNAFAQLRNGRPAPVVLEMPVDLLTEEASARYVSQYRRAQRYRTVPDGADLNKFIAAILEAKAPVIVAGQGVLYGQATAELVAFADLLQIPVLTTLNGKSAFPENHALSLGCGAQSQPTPVVHFLAKSDVIIGFGTSFTENPYITPYPIKGRQFLQVTNCEADISKSYPIDVALLADVKLTLAALVEELARSQAARKVRWRASTAAEVAAQKQAFAESWRGLLESDEVPITPYRVVSELMKATDRTRTVVTHDAGSPRDQITATYESIVPHGYLGWGKSTQLGFGLGLIQGAKLARPDWVCVNIMGDASIGMVGMDLETGVREEIATTTVVLKNSIMGIYSDYLPHASKTHRINVVGGDYEKLMQSFGGYAETVKSPGELAGAYKRAFANNAEGRPSLIQVITREEKRRAIFDFESHPEWRRS